MLSLSPSPSMTSQIDNKKLSPKSTLKDLPMHHVTMNVSDLVIDVVRCFEENKIVPGIILMDGDRLAGMLSRRRFLERMSRPYSIELFLKRPITVIYSFTKIHVDVFAEDLLIVKAARRSLKRPPELLYEPIVVQQVKGTSTYALIDVHELLQAQSRIHKLTSRLLDESNYAQRVQTEKMVSLGHMVSGVAHEIKNPVNSVYGNVDFLENYFNNLIELVNGYQAFIGNKPDKLLELEEELDLEFILEDAPKIIKSIQIGSERLTQIVTSLRNFSRVDDRSKQLINIHDCINGTLLILENRTKYDIEVIRDYEKLPDIACYSGQLSQVFMNLLANAIDVLLEKKAQLQDETWQPTITIKTQQIEDHQGERLISIKIIDNGLGIPPENQQKIFDNYFTTKPVGKGTGLGLAISYQIVAEKHEGELKLRSQVGKWTEFEVLLPLLMQ
ncbi:MAG: ATP-binding protein [Spirulina sp. SIO3F2]|nr:ATP-binding protein [Spirulina sp. SIO3F2]